jgi:hypothetical protein
MANLDLTADKAVRDAVDAFVEGRLVPDFVGETVFETKNSRYRLLDGVVFAAPDDSLVGSELVGWLMESRHRSVVESAWQPGSRAVLVDRHHARNIIVTSTTRLLHLEEHASRAGVAPPVPPLVPRPWGPGPPAPSPHRPPIVASTPLPPQVTAAPIQSAAAVQKRAAAIHLPPRPIAPAPRAAAAMPTPLPQPARPLPEPALPPRRGGPSLPQVNAQVPAAGTAWELTSSEFEVDVEATKPDYTPGNSAQHNASRHDVYDPSDTSTDEMVDGPESGGDAPILLVRPLDPAALAPTPTHPVAAPQVPRPRR